MWLMALIDKIKGKQAEEQSAFINIPRDEVIKKTLNNNGDTSTMNNTNTTDCLCDPPEKSILVKYYQHDNTFRDLIDITSVITEGRITVMNPDRLPSVLGRYRDHFILEDGIVTKEFRELTQTDITSYYCAYLGEIVYPIGTTIFYDLDADCLVAIPGEGIDAPLVMYDCRKKIFTKYDKSKKEITKDDTRYINIVNIGDFIFNNGGKLDGITHSKQLEIRVWYKEAAKKDEDDKTVHTYTTAEVYDILNNINNTPRGTAYLVDSENMGLSWLELLEKMTPNDTVYVFFTNSPNAPKISYNDLALIMGCSVLGEGKKNVEFVTCMSGKNAVDIQMCVMYGYLIAKNEYKNIEILSHDTAFEFSINIGERLMNMEQK